MKPSERFMLAFIAVTYMAATALAASVDPWIALWMVLMLPFVWGFAYFLEWLDR